MKAPKELQEKLERECSKAEPTAKEEYHKYKTDYHDHIVLGFAEEYIIDLEKENEELKSENQELKKISEEVKADMQKVASMLEALKLLI